MIKNRFIFNQGNYPVNIKVSHYVQVIDKVTQLKI